ncbi:hypothetical protein D3C71_276830 [compost metagenome]
MVRIKVVTGRPKDGRPTKWIAKGTGLPMDYGLGLTPIAAFDDLLNRRLCGLVPGM